jgi:hypothetical protein
MLLHDKTCQIHPDHRIEVHFSLKNQEDVYGIIGTENAI